MTQGGNISRQTVNRRDNLDRYTVKTALELLNVRKLLDLADKSLENIYIISRFL